MIGNELRIGNWVTANTYPPMIVAAVMKHDIECCIPKAESDNFDFEITEIQGIPLTEDILLKCAGFGKYDVEKNELRIDCFNDLTLYCGETNIVQDKDGNFYSCFIGANYVEETAIYTIGEPFKFLHTFQNRFHSLTQKELTVQL